MAPEILQSVLTDVNAMLCRGLFAEADKAISNFDEQTAETMLLQGKIKGFILDHDSAKDLLFAAIELFEAERNAPKIAECLNHLARTYLRNGEIEEAKAYLFAARPYKSPENLVTELAILLDESKFKEILRTQCPDFADADILANFHNYRGVAFRKLNQTEFALNELQTAKGLFDLCGHFAYSGAVGNNLANICLDRKDFDSAHYHADEAINVFTQCDNFARLASSLDTKATIFYREKRLDEALRVINQSIEILRVHQYIPYFLESCKTKIKILVALNREPEALRLFVEAENVATVQSGEKTAENFSDAIGEIFSQRKQKLLSGVYLEAELSRLADYENKPLTFPDLYKNNCRHFCAEITNSLFADVGLIRGSLAVIADISAENGDLTAIELNSQVVIGFLRTDFGVTALILPDREPVIAVGGIIGKVVGVGILENETIKVRLI